MLPYDGEAGPGVIVNVSSKATRGIYRMPYSAAKGGVNAITASLAMEYADAGIRVVATAPGGTEAPPRRISRGTPEPQMPPNGPGTRHTSTRPSTHRCSSDTARWTSRPRRSCFLASDEASYITGTVLPVAGGDLG